jgi:hypothetical protein
MIKSNAYVCVPIAYDTHETKSTSTINYWAVLLAVSLGMSVSASVGISNELSITIASAFWHVVVLSSTVLLSLSYLALWVLRAVVVIEDKVEDETDDGEDKTNEEGCDAHALDHLFMLGFMINQLYLLGHELMHSILLHIIVYLEISDTSVKAIVVTNLALSLLWVLIASTLAYNIVVYYLDKAKSERKVWTDYELNVSIA